jgi:hypothetical protein
VRLKGSEPDGEVDRTTLLLVDGDEELHFVTNHVLLEIKKTKRETHIRE